jgi:hypothetical protein
MPRRYSFTLPLMVALTASVLAGCSGTDDASSDPDALLAAARTSLDQTTSVHFSLTSTDVPTTGTRLVSGEGEVARPNSFQGKLGILLNGSQVSVELVSAGGKVYAKLPFSEDFQVTDPASFGLSDPANLIDSKNGITRMFGELTNISNQGDQRIEGDVVTKLNGSLPGSLVEDLLTSADPAKPVKAELYITKETKQLRRAVLTGPFFEKERDSAFNLVLDKYGTPVTITAPAMP